MSLAQAGICSLRLWLPGLRWNAQSNAVLSGLGRVVWSCAVWAWISSLRSSGLDWDVLSGLGWLVQPNLDDKFAEIRSEAVCSEIVPSDQKSPACAWKVRRSLSGQGWSVR